MRVTIKKIAAHTGLSMPTVGNILGRNAHQYSAATQEKVRRAVEELGYRPNASARAISSGKFGCAVLILSTNPRVSDVPQDLITGLDEELVRNGMHLSICRLPEREFAETDFVPRVLRESYADGLIINYTHNFPRQMVDLIHEHRTPAVWVNVKLPKDCVHPDDVAAADDATNRLIELGHQRIGYLHLRGTPGGDPPITFAEFKEGDHYSAADRTTGYTDAMKRAGLRVNVISPNGFVEYDEHLSFCRNMLTATDRPSAIVTYSPPTATTVFIAALNLGLKVPQDLSIVTFDHDPWRRTAGIDMSTMVIPAREEGRRAVQLLLKKIDAPAKRLDSIGVPLTFHPGQTVAAP